MALPLDAPIEDLKLSRRVHNLLRRKGFQTLGSLLAADWKFPCRGFGPAVRMELACALEANGFSSPLGLAKSELNDIVLGVSGLRKQIEASFRIWDSQLGRFETRLQELTRIAGRAIVQEFNTPVTVIRAASSGLLETAALTATERETVTMVKEESVRLSTFLERISGLLPEAMYCAGATNDISQPLGREGRNEHQPDACGSQSPEAVTR